MAVREVEASGLEAQRLATQLLHRVRRADPLAGVWEAADIQWWWRKPRPSDQVDKTFWMGDDGPVAGILLTSSSGGPWQCDPLVLPGTNSALAEEVWQQALALGDKHSPQGIDVPVNDGDETSVALALLCGLTAGNHDRTAWLSASDRPAVTAPAVTAPGYHLVDRSDRPDQPHPMQGHNGDDVARRLDECTLYDPQLDLRVETQEGRVAAYSLYWFDSETKVGLVEPVRVEDEFQRQGLASAMLREGISRLVDRGAERVKIAYQTEAAAATYLSIGFRPTSTATWYQRR